VQTLKKETGIVFYDLAILTIKPNQLGPVMGALPDSAAASVPNGRLLGCFNCDIGALNRVAVLSVYEELAALEADRVAYLSTPDPYGCSANLSAIDRGAFKPLSFAKDITVGEHGPFYEIRTYEVAAGGIPETEAAWAKVMDERNEISPLLAIMASVATHPTRMVHIWPYKTLDDRAKARAEASRRKIWPPPGGSNHLLSLRSDIFVPLPFSPLK